MKSIKENEGQYRNLQPVKMKTCDRTVLSLGSDPRGDIVDLDEDAFPLPVGMRNAEEAIFDQLPAGRTPGCKIGCERG